MKTRSCCGTVVECRTRDPEVPSSNPGVGKMKISHRSNQNNTTTNPSAPELNTCNYQRWKPEVTVAHCRVQGYRSRGPQFKPWCGKKENLSQVQSEQYHHQSLCTRLHYVELSQVKIRSHHVTVVECSTRDPEVPSSNPGVDKKKIFHGSNQNNTTTNPSALGVKTWIYQRWKPEGAVEQWESAGLEIQRSPVQTLVWAKRKSLTGPIRTLPPPIPLHQSSIPEIVRGENQK